MRALSIRQPYAEEILQGIKTIEYRPNPTKKIGERFFIYAALKYPSAKDLRKFCKRYRTIEAIQQAEAQGIIHRGVIVGIATISHVTPPTKGPGGMPFYHWHLTDVERLELPMKPHRMPQAQWFAPFNLPTGPKANASNKKPSTLRLKLVRD